MIQGLIELLDVDYTPQLWHGTLLLYAILLLCILMNTGIGTALPKVETILLIVYVLGFFGCLIPLVYLAPHSNSKTVFTVFLNNGGWDSQTTSFFVGLSGNAFAFLGNFLHLTKVMRDTPN